MSQFVKIYQSILDSSVWSTSKEVRILWITMLAMADQDGLVEASVGGLARRAGLTREECSEALDVLSSPDPDDKSGVDEGRRVSRAGGGWLLTNHAAYRDLRTNKQIRVAERVKKHRSGGVTGNACNAPVTLVTLVTPRSDQIRSDPDLTPASIRGPDTSPARGEQSTPPATMEVLWDERETSCPLDLLARLQSAGMHIQLAEALRADVGAVVAELSEFVSYWTIGAGMGQRRRHWARLARERVRRRAGEGMLAAPGAIDHAARPKNRAQSGRGGSPEPLSALVPSENVPYHQAWSPKS